MHQTLRIIFIFLTTFGKINCGVVVGRSDETDRRISIINCIFTILDRVYVNSLESGTIATLLDEYTHKYTQDLLLDRTFRENKWSVVSFKRKNNSEKFPMYSFIDMYLVKLINIDEAEVNLNYLSTKYWNPRAKMIIFIEQLNGQNKDEFKKVIFETLWKQKSMDAIVLYPKNDGGTVFEAYTWFPYHFGNCGKYEKAILIDTCDNGSYRLNKEMFPEKIPRSFNGCQVRVRAVIWPPYVNPPQTLNSTKNISRIFTSGIEIELLNLIANELNLSLIYSVSSTPENWGGIYDNGTGVGLFETLLNEEADLGIGCLTSTKNRLMYLDPSVAYGFESITWLVPNAPRKPEWLNLIYVYDLETYIFILVTFLIISLVTYFISCAIEESTSYRIFGNSFMNLLAVFWGLSLKFKPMYSSSRLVFFTCAFLNLIIAAVYQTTLIGFLAQPIYDKQITKIEEIFNTKLEIFFLQQVSIYYTFDTEDWRMRKILNESIPCPNATECITNVGKFGNSSIAIPRLILLYSLDKLTTKDGRLLVHWFEHDMVSFPIHIFMTKGYPLANLINTHIVQIMQTGIMDKIQKDLKEKLNKKDRSVKKMDTQVNFVLGIIHLKLAFVILLVGLGISSIVFLLELVIYKKKKPFVFIL